jgi:hypothetical protein
MREVPESRGRSGKRAGGEAGGRRVGSERWPVMALPPCHRDSGREGGREKGIGT